MRRNTENLLDQSLRIGEFTSGEMAVRRLLGHQNWMLNLGLNPFGLQKRIQFISSSGANLIGVVDILFTFFLHGDAHHFGQLRVIPRGDLSTLLNDLSDSSETAQKYSRL